MPPDEERSHWYEGYFDESGSLDPNCRNIAIAGVLAPAENWEGFFPAWRQAIDDAGVSRAHAAHCYGGTNEFSNKQGWTVTRRIAFMKKLADIIFDVVPHVIYAFIARETWDSLSDREKEMFGGNPWFLCLQRCLHDISGILEVSGLGGRIVLDRQLEYKAEGNRLWSSVRQSGWFGGSRIGQFIMGDSSQIFPLQVADMIAHEITRHAREKTPNFALDKLSQRSLPMLGVELTREVIDAARSV